ncbi:MAG: twin transmembrane helix small protein [Methylococcaceae bacterium]|nr:twin transmembrane helix small protein [Methylococcaceae bacterium]MCI0667550.1 twin transmembrane helix small protein [Methylococcaceae bacterium]MCI0734033.1 twin transmembrane helix small protein [Methylococcaceae bacterium]
MTLLKILIFIALVLTVLSMVAGIGVMGEGGKLNKNLSNLLMRWRVWLQGITVVLLLLAIILN